MADIINISEFKDVRYILDNEWTLLEWNLHLKEPTVPYSSTVGYEKYKWNPNPIEDILPKDVSDFSWFEKTNSKEHPIMKQGELFINNINIGQVNTKSFQIEEENKNE